MSRITVRLLKESDVDVNTIISRRVYTRDWTDTHFINMILWANDWRVKTLKLLATGDSLRFERTDFWQGWYI